MKDRLWNSLKIACSMYSKIPVPQADWTKENKAYVMCFFPWVGVVIAGLMLALYQVKVLVGETVYGFPDLFFTVLFVLLPVWVTGGIHLDGYLDTQDALHSYQPRERKLEILKDPHTGAFAVIAGICYFVLELGIYSGLTAESVKVAAAGFVLSRALSGLSVVCFPQARKKGMAADFSNGASKKGCRAVLTIYVILSMAVMVLAGGVPGIAAAAAATGVFVYYRHMTKKIFGGMTGDLAGYFLQLCEIWIAGAAVITDLLMKGA
nr:adenosylcobinamide-GDP ribazoletransferase [uncultured Merdimonas sp.]